MDGSRVQSLAQETALHVCVCGHLQPCYAISRDLLLAYTHRQASKPSHLRLGRLESLQASSRHPINYRCRWMVLPPIFSQQQQQTNTARVAGKRQDSKVLVFHIPATFRVLEQEHITGNKPVRFLTLKRESIDE